MLDVDISECACCGFFFSSGRRHTRCALVTGVQTCALPISGAANRNRVAAESATELHGTVISLTAFARCLQSLITGFAAFQVFDPFASRSVAVGELVGFAKRRQRAVDVGLLVLRETQRQPGLAPGFVARLAELPGLLERLRRCGLLVAIHVPLRELLVGGGVGRGLP